VPLTTAGSLSTSSRAPASSTTSEPFRVLPVYALVAHEKVAEAGVVAQSDELTGQAIVAFVTLQGELEGTPEIEAQIRGHVAEHIGKLARPKRILWSEDLPKTRSGKIMRRLLRDIAEGRALGDVTTLRDPAVMAELEQKVAAAHAQED
jgi:acetyl-CoA synthetase